MKSKIAWVHLLLASLLLTVTACKSVEQRIRADIWLHEQIPASVCAKNPGLQELGVYRKVTCDDGAVQRGVCQPGDKVYEEFISYCHPAIVNYLGMHKNSFNNYQRELSEYKRKYCQQR